MSMSMREALEYMASLIRATGMYPADAAQAAAMVYQVNAHTLLTAYEERP